MGTIENAKTVCKKVLCWYTTILKPKSLFDIPLFVRVYYACKGFNPNEYVWYDLKHNDYRNYISEYERILSRSINGKYKLLLDNKLLFEELLCKYIYVPQNYAWVNDEKVYGLHGVNLDTDNLIDFFIEHKVLVVKWEAGFEGKGTYIVRHINDMTFDINGEHCDDRKLKEIIFKHGNSIICEYVHQSSFENELFPNATNTLRIVCAKKKDEKSVKILRAVQRIGTNESKPVDNVSAGALAAPIDIETGVLGQAILAKSHDRNELFKKYATHPDTGATIAGKAVPNWNFIKKTIVDITNKFPFLNFVAWDVLLSDQGMCLIEGNASAGLMMFQAEHGVRNEEIGDIYRSYDIIK